MDSVVSFDKASRARLTNTAINAARTMLRYSFIEVNFEYAKLTETERALITEDEFNLMVHQFKLK